MTQALTLTLAAAITLLPAVGQEEPLTSFDLTMARAERSLEAGQLDGARALIQRALERDRKSIAAWALRARWAMASGDRDEEVYSRHMQLRHAQAQGLERSQLRDLEQGLYELDPLARDLYDLKQRFLRKLEPLAQAYEKARRPHSAIAVLKQILVLDPENQEAQVGIERIAASPDPSLAGDAKPKDLFADVSDEWIRGFDEEHSSWETAGEVERENYITVTDAGYAVLIRASEAMEQMNGFYREYFRYGTEEDGKSVPRIRVHVFRNRDEYLTLGIGPPVEWSGGHYTGNAVETYIDSSFESMVGTLFHEAAHQFVSLATRAVGWLNEGLASFFEGTRILPNGTVIMNMPANHRLFPLAERMEKGWMAHPQDGYDPNDSDSTPETAPTFRIVIENRYSWGPPWYAPTWGLVFFLYNYQDPIDGRYVYRDAFMEFVDASGGKTGDTAVGTFEEVVLANPKPPLEFVERPEGSDALDLPQTVDDVDAVWKDWILALRDEQAGRSEVQRPYAQWGRYAVENKDYAVAKEHFEKGLVADPGNVELLLEFAALLSKHFANADRAVKLAVEALYYLEQADEPDQKQIREVERLLSKLDPKRRTLARIQDELAASTRNIVERYAAAGLNLMVMDVAWRAGSELKLEDMLGYYERAVRDSGRSLAIWELAYNEQNLDGWASGVPSFRANGVSLAAQMGEFAEDRFDFQFLTMDRLTAGDFSMEARVLAPKGEVNFCGFVFGQKGPSTFHGMLFFPGKQVAEGGVESGYLDLMSSYGTGAMKTWSHIPVDTSEPDEETSSGVWRTLRLDVVGRNVDLWYEGELIGTREFPSRDVLRGAFGLIMGPGAAEFRDLRFLARDPADPASGIERTLRMEALTGQSGGAIGGSFQGMKPPFPKVNRWVQGERSSWEEVRLAPQLLVFWSIQQNDLVRIDEWLTYLEEGYRDVGLEVLSIVSRHDDDQLDAYLGQHPFPGTVGVDFLTENAVGIGESFEEFYIRRFNLPRLLLLDLQGRVLWEGDPGFEINTRPVEPYDSFLDDPLAELVDSSRLRDIAVWRTKWESYLQPDLRSGDFAPALDGLREAGEFDPAIAPDAGRAAAGLRVVEAALGDLEGTGEVFTRDGVEPAMTALFQWAEALSAEEFDPKLKRPARGVLSSKNSRAWTKVLRACDAFQARRGESEQKAPELLEDLGAASGRFAEELLQDLVQASEAGDWDAFNGLVAGAGARPAIYLACEFIGW